MTREEFYSDDVCVSVAQVYCRRARLPGLTNPDGRWPQVGSDISKRQCDAYIDKACGGRVQGAYDAAYDYLADDTLAPG